ncbi:probable inactive receptor kinase RLK902 [Olea europaea var. sylvestris]|uniref:probable inactive receptor kinase RLK902 n=1 Tax=Olea europaea var. sylvestris TaxID=158386 RepID=UPI000C1D41EF|nr:probable inactive receptor kinase RLK902 [Olea europaea var. sylvestris]
MVSFLLHSLFPLFFLLSLNSIAIVFSDLEADRSALLRLREAVGGRTRRWNTSSTNPCLWDGVKCDNVTNRVTEVRLPGDGLTGQLPPNTIGNLTELQVLSLRENDLSGPIPSDLGSCIMLNKLQLQGNRFSGEIPETLFTLKNLKFLNLAWNKFSGDMSSALNNLTKLRALYLENNGFTGSLPHLNSLTGLREFNVSFNALMGSIPPRLDTFSNLSYLGTSLCGRPLDPCPSNGNKLSGGAIAGITIGSVIGLLLILVIMFILWRSYRSREILPRVANSPIPPSPPYNGFPSPMPLVTEAKDQQFSYSFASKERVGKVVVQGGNDGLVLFGEDVEMFSLEELLRASAEVLGNGTVGTTYKAYLESGVQVIVKRLKNVCLSEKEFRIEIEELGSLIHENLVPLRGYFYGTEEKLLIFEPMPRSLSIVLHGNNRRSLNWEIRCKIALGVANGIQYLHSLNHNNTHGNIKSSNVLLTEYYDACPTEFGLTRLVSNITSSNLNGYQAPEVKDSRKISKKADVYSFGILLLELLTGKEPDSVLIEDGINLPSWVQSVEQEKWTVEVFDPDLIRFDYFKDQTVQILNLAISCTAQHPDRRPSMVEITQRIEEICA